MIVGNSFTQTAIANFFVQLESHKECIYDRVVIYEGSSEGSIPIDILCGQTTQGTHVWAHVFANKTAQSIEKSASFESMI